jgi:dephospho-CoA kinase
MLVIGLTGGIASGKSTVAQILAELGATVIDADKVGHEAFRPHSDAWREVVATFGSGILGQKEEIDRSKLADIVFSDPKALEQLNLIMHPMIHQIVEQRIEALRCQGVEVVVLEAALLIEANWIDLVEQVWVTIAPEATVISRLCSEKGFTEEQARARINSQMSVAEKSRYADVVIENDSGLDRLRERVEGLWQKTQSTGND